MSASKKEQRRLTVHPHLIYDVITMQAGTLSKAIQEGVQNTFDAGATRCDVRLTSAQFTVTDDGKGFGSREEVEQFFEVFGLPHEPTSGTQRLTSKRQRDRTNELRLCYKSLQTGRIAGNEWLQRQNGALGLRTKISGRFNVLASWTTHQARHPSSHNICYFDLSLNADVTSHPYPRELCRQGPASSPLCA